MQLHSIFAVTPFSRAAAEVDMPVTAHFPAPFHAPAADATPGLARFYMTSDLRAATGLTRSHLDFYLREGVILPTARTESGYLLFDASELAVVQQVIAWRQEGVSVREIRARLNRATEAETAEAAQ